MLLGLRVAALLLLCTPGSATVEELSTGLKAKLEQMGTDSMAKRVTAHAANSNHMHTTTHSRPHMPPPQTTARHHGPAYCKGIMMRRHTIMPHPHCRRVWVAWRASWAVISSSTRRPGSMYTAHALHVHHTCSALTLRTHARTAPHRPQCDAATDLPQDVVLNACLIGGVAAGG